MLTIRHANTYLEERKYIYDIVFQEFWNISYQSIVEDRCDICIENEGKFIVVNDEFFQLGEQFYLSTCSLPEQPVQIWKTSTELANSCFTDTELPVIYGQPIQGETYISIINPQIRIGIDIFGSAFFMMTRYEEVVKENRDEHDRFPAKDSLAYQEGFLERPIINEYIELLWWSIQQLWPEIERKQRKFTIIPTHDVDSPFEFAFLSPYQILHTLAGDLLKRHSLRKFISRGYFASKVKSGDFQADINYTFDLIMDISEKNNLKSRFYMMEAQNLSSYDGNYDLEHQVIIRLMKQILARGHEIGIHPSYASHKNGNEINREVQHLKNILARNKLKVKALGGRQHFLKWSCPETWQHYEDAGISYDTTLSYADHIGFRCGICYEYPVFNLRTRQMLKLREKPLLIMECSALDKRYMNLSPEVALQRFLAIKEMCWKYRGEFVVLWHNNRFIKQEEIKMYEALVESFP